MKGGNRRLRRHLTTRRSQVPGSLASWIVWPNPEPLAPLELIIEAPGRLASDGKVVREFDRDVSLQRLQTVVDQKPDAVTISPINSFDSPVHEQAARQAVNEFLPGVPVSISFEVLPELMEPELMEYERTITTVVLTNDLYSVAGAVSHHTNWVILMPIFVDDKLIAWTSNFGHMTDVGGSVPGSLPCAASNIFEEGIQIPVTKIGSRSVWNTDLIELIY